MKIIKKSVKILFILMLVLAAGLAVLDIYLIKKPEMEAKRKIAGIETVAANINDLTINDNARIIGLGEAAHGNAEFQELKLDVLKVLAEKHGVSGFALEMDYGEGVIINDYISGHAGMSIDEVMQAVNFTIYRTEDIRNLIEWMKEYNTAHAGSLSFYGFDLQNPDVELNLILAFMAEHAIGEDLDLAGSFASFLNGDTGFRDESLQEGFEKLNLLKTELETNRDAYQELYNYNRILDCIDNVLRARELAARYAGDDSMTEGGRYRDEMMAERVMEIAAAMPDSRLMISGHNGHIGYAGSYTKTMGSFIRDELGDQYFAIGTDYFISLCNMPDSSGRRADHRFVSGDILAYQARDLGTYYLDFSRADKESELYGYIDKPIYTGSLGEGYSILNTILQDTVRLYCEPDFLYDAMILVYECTPLRLLDTAE